MTTIKLANTVDIASAAKLHEELKVALANEQPVTLDGSDVERADTAALQLLYAFYRDAQQLAVTVEWLPPSEQLLETAAHIGLQEKLGLAHS
jgi:anti-anti-sigma regulatory factor